MPQRAGAGRRHLQLLSTCICLCQECMVSLCLHEAAGHHPQPSKKRAAPTCLTCLQQAPHPWIPARRLHFEGFLRPQTLAMVQPRPPCPTVQTANMVCSMHLTHAFSACRHPTPAESTHSPRFHRDGQHAPHLEKESRRPAPELECWERAADTAALSTGFQQPCKVKYRKKPGVPAPESTTSSGKSGHVCGFDSEPCKQSAPILQLP